MRGREKKEEKSEGKLEIKGKKIVTKGSP